MKKSELETKTYKELQEMNKSMGAPFVGVAREDLIEKIAETEVSEEEIPQEEFMEPVDTTVTPKLTTTANFGKEEFKPVNESIPTVEFKTKMVRIKPRKNIPRSYIGPDVWELKVGKIYEVPEEVARIFENGGYL